MSIPFEMATVSSKSQNVSGVPLTTKTMSAGGSRVLVENVTPAVDGGPYAVKRVVGDELRVEADLICDGHDIVTGRVLYRAPGGSLWHEVRLQPLLNDRFAAAFTVDQLGVWEFTVEGCVDGFATWRRTFDRKQQGASPEDVIAHLRLGAAILLATAARAPDPDRSLLRAAAQKLDDAEQKPREAAGAGADPALLTLASRYPAFENAGRPAGVFFLVGEPKLAAFSAWYEFFPRSTGAPGEHGTLRSSYARLEYAAQMGFDIVYLPPIHPIGRSFRKGRNNTPSASPDDPGSPWAIGSSEGGHKSVHPELGTLADFRAFVARARELGLEVALDIALQASPDHPYVSEHPEWFAKRPDGSIQYAENPPKKYQDIYPFDFECAAAPALWQELTSIFLFWAEQGVKVFRVDNPHTKSLPFWGYCITELKRRHPDAILLAEAFTRPKLMYALAKLGFSQSYTYFTWRNTKHEFTAYLTELTKTDVAEFFRPNFWPNTPDILPEHLQYGGRAAFIMRLILAATLSSNYGIYGPPFELMEHLVRPGAEEYAGQREVRDQALGRGQSRQPARAAHADQPDPPRQPVSARQRQPGVSSDRQQGAALLQQASRRQHRHHRREPRSAPPSVWLAGARPDETRDSTSATYQVHDQLSNARYLWSGARSYVELDPAGMPAHVFVVRYRVRSEADFDYFA